MLSKTLVVFLYGCHQRNRRTHRQYRFSAVLVNQQFIVCGDALVPAQCFDTEVGLKMSNLVLSDVVTCGRGLDIGHFEDWV